MAPRRGSYSSHVFQHAGRYPLGLRVTDDSGSRCAVGEVAGEVVINGTPQARIQASSLIAHTGGAHDEIRFDATGSTDPDEDPLVFQWDFGDSASGRGSVVTHAFTKPGRYEVTLSAEDDAGTSCSEGTARIVIEARAPLDPD